MTISRRQFATKASLFGAGLASAAMASDMVMAQIRKRNTPLDDLWKGTQNMKSGDAPISIKYSTLLVNDLQKVGEFYQSILGLDLLRSDGEEWALGAGGKTLLVLQKDSHARRYPTEAGLFHNAFLMPDRAALGRWLHHASDEMVHFTGMADHMVSEAVYLDDPEGNGIEVYADRDAKGWTFKADGQLRLDTTRMDVQSVLGAADGAWAGAPDGLIMGHVHLQVGDMDTVHAFMTEQLGQDLMTHEGSAAFYSSGGYHHHFAGNIWNSRGAGGRSRNSTGLAGVTLRSDGSRLQPGTMTDPWGNQFTVEAA